jgi:3-deoxy-D-manno-octulosonic-acid transferase
MKLVYNLFIQLYYYTAKAISYYNPKAKKWVNGRKNIFDELTKAFANNTCKVVWFHCASLGEFEQARPVIEALGRGKKETKILLTFFSPSGYEIQKKYAGANWVFYLPIDTKANAIQFYKIINPSLIVFVKYEFWYHYITQAKQLNIPLLLISGVFRSSQPFFKWYGNLHKKMLQCFAHLFLQNQESVNLLCFINIKNNVTLCGDTRFDRVVEIASKKVNFIDIENFIGNAKTIVAGSTWAEDDRELHHFANNNTHIKFIVAPHEISENRLQQCLKMYNNAVLYSNIKNAKNNCNVVIIDNVGMLSKLYSYATITFVGGGFGANGVHNVLEAAVYAKPIIFGYIYHKYIEAEELKNTQAACVVKNTLDLENVINTLLNDENKYNLFCNNAKKYVLNNTGATSKIIEYITVHFALGNK